MSTRVFISYSHRDAGALERLHVHLANLRREARIDAWFDREILAGDVLDAEIERELEAANLFLLLVSPDFIASDYCIEREMQRALERHDQGEARVVPIIVEPCEWAAIPALRRLKAVPKDGMPISDWTNANTAYLNVVQEIRRIIDAGDMAAPAVTTNDPAQAPRRPPASRYRVQRDFDDIDRSEFREAAFATIKDYFRRAAAEINAVDGLRGRFADLSPTSFGCTVVNRGRRHGTAHITVHRRNARFALGDLYFSFEENAEENTANGGFNLSADEYEQFLINAMTFGPEPGRMNPEQAAEYLWEQFLRQAGIDQT